MSATFTFGTVGAPISNPKKPGGSAGAVYHIKQLGLGALELGWVRSVRVSEETCVSIREAVQETGVLLSIHAPYYINLNGDAVEWPKSRARLMAAAHYGNLAGATEIIFHPGSYQNKSPSEVVSIAISRLQGCVSELRQDNNFVTLRPETMGRAGQLGKFEETLEMSKAIKGVQPCVDFAHLHARAGDGSMNSYAEWVKVLEVYEKELGTDALRNMSCHLSGIEYGPRGERHHLVLKEADIKIEELFKALKDAGAGGRILSESPNLEEDALVFQKTWDTIAK
ncbi:MAG: TIM barrel protein [Anaerolineales bacterium]